MVDYARLAQTASDLLEDLGQQVTITRRTVSAFDGATGIETLGTATTFTGWGAGFNFKKSEIDGTVIQAGDIKLLLEATTTAPIIGDMVTYESIDYRVMDVDRLSPGGVVLRFNLQLRK